MKVIVALFVAAFLVGSAQAGWMDCNKPSNKAACEAEFQAFEAQRKIDQASMSNADFCEKYAVCGGGAGGK